MEKLESASIQWKTEGIISKEFPHFIASHGSYHNYQIFLLPIVVELFKDIKCKVFLI